MVKKIVCVCCMLALMTLGASAQRITESLTNWTLGSNPAQITSTLRSDGTTGNVVYLPIGTSPTYYEVMTEGEGSVEFWIYDPANCVDSINPGYSTRGCGWGLQSPLYQAGYVTIDRANYVAGCQGYSPWSTVAPYSPYWFSGGVRTASFTAGWYKWTVSGTWDDMTFTFDERVTKTYDGTSNGNAWEALFGEGWKAFVVKGDGGTGVEDIKVDVTNGTGIFAGMSTAVAAQYNRSTWSDIKRQYRR